MSGCRHMRRPFIDTLIVALFVSTVSIKHGSFSWLKYHSGTMATFPTKL
jgi:hypothetical protein